MKQIKHDKSSEALIFNLLGFTKGSHTAFLLLINNNYDMVKNVLDKRLNFLAEIYPYGNRDHHGDLEKNKIHRAIDYVDDIHQEITKKINE